MLDVRAILSGIRDNFLAQAGAQEFSVWLQWIGGGSLIFLAVLMITMVMRALATGAALTRRTLATQALTASKSHELLIVIADCRERGGRKYRKAIEEALENHFGAFVFNAQKLVRFFPESLAVPRPDTAPGLRLNTIAEARNLLKQSGADLFVWMSARSGSRSNLRLMAVVAEEWTGHREIDPIECEIHDRPENWTLETREALAYILARAVRPILSRPPDFRVEKLMPIVERLAVMRESAHCFDRATAALMTSDYAAGALSLAERGGGQAWYERAYQARLAALAETDRAKDPVAHAFGELELGRALAGMGAKNFDNAMLTQAAVHLRQALDSLREQEVLAQAEAAARSLQKIEQAIADSKRVFLRFPG